MKRGTLIIIVLAAFCLGSNGQGKIGQNAGSTIFGKLIDSLTHSPLESATVSIYPAGKNTVLRRTTSDSAGAFSLTGIPPGSYTVVIESVGYRTINFKNIIIGPRSGLINLKNIEAPRRSAALQSVIVTAPPKLVDNKIDKLVFNAERDISSQTGVATDLLKKVPQVSVDVDGNVELEGSANVLFLINGKPSTIFGGNITDVLQSIPANQIKSIEVITNPGAKYDAQGTGGIINIILKHNTIQGINGNVSLTAGTIVQNGSVNLNARRGKFGLNAFVNGNARLTTNTPTSFRRVSTDTIAKSTAILQQDGSSDFNRYGVQSGIGADWTPDEANSLSGGLNFHGFGNDQKGSITQGEQSQNAAGSMLSQTISINRTTRSFSETSFDPSLDYKHNFRNKDQQLEIGADGSFGSNVIHSGNDQYLQPQDSLVYGTRNRNPAHENEYEVKVDYVQPLHKDINLGLGGKFTGYDIVSSGNAGVWAPFIHTYADNPALSNDLNYHQKVYAAYSELNFPVGKSLEARLGGRYERTQVHSFYGDAQQTIDKGYNTFIPSVFLMQKIGEDQTIKLNYTIRINRPDYSDLNPFVNASDPKNITTGNPDLKPEIWDRYEAVYNYDLGKRGSFMITLFYRQSNGDIQSFVIYYPSIQAGDTTYTNVGVTTHKNIGVEKNAGTNLFFDLHITDKFSIRSNLMLLFRRTINEVDVGYNSTGTLFRSNINAAYQFTGSLAAEFFGNFNSAHHEAQGNYPSFTSYTLAVRKLFWNKKGSLALTANNIFSRYVDQRTDLIGPGFASSSLRRIPYQSVGINFTWKFGRLEIAKEKPEDNGIDLSLPQQ